MSASNLFGRGLGLEKIQKLMKEYPDIVMSNDSKETKRSKCIKIKGFAKTTCDNFIENIDEFVDWMNATGLQDKLTAGAGATGAAATGAGATGAAATGASVLGKRAGEYHAISGISDKKQKIDLLKLLSDNGIHIDNSVKKTTDALHIPPNHYTSNKYKAALKNNIPIYEYTSLEEHAAKLEL